MGVDLGRGDTLVTEHLLHLTNACTALQQVGGEGVSQGVGTDSFVDAGKLGSLTDDGKDHYAS